MSIGAFIIERLAEVSTIVLHIYFLYRTLETKVGIKKQIVAGTVLLIIKMAYCILNFGYKPFFSVFIVLIYSAYVFFGQLRAYFIWSIIPIILDGIVESTIINFFLLIPNSLPEQVFLYGIQRITLIFISRVTLLGVYYFITRKVDKSALINWGNCFSLLIVPIGCWVLLEIVFLFSDTFTGQMMSPLLATGSTVLLLIMASTISLYNQLITNSKELAQSKVQLRTAELTQDHISQINDVYSKISSIQHDLKNHFTVISGYLKTKEYFALEQYMKKFTNIDVDVLEYSNHPVLNALISSKATIAHKSNVDFKVIIELTKQLPIADVDLCILVSNILDNAFEANERVVEPRFINLCIRIVNSYLVVVCHNSTCEKKHFRTRRALKSTKEVEGIHGIGTKQIQKIAEESGGFVTYRHENCKFTTMVMIKLAAY